MKLFARRSNAIAIASNWPPVKVNQLIFSLSCILFALLTTLAIVLNGADCLTSFHNSSSSSSDRVFVVKSASTNQASPKKLKETFKEVFDTMTIQVKENTPIGSKLTDISTAEHDNQNAPSTYAIIGGPDEQSFTLRKDTSLNRVELLNEVNFDYESSKRSYNIVIRATSLFLRYELVVDIIVTDENDNEPQLDDFAIVFNNYKNHFPTAPIGRVPATDADINDQLHYKILSGNNAQLIVVNETNGDIQLSPWLNTNVPMRAVIEILVSDGQNEDKAHLVLTVNLVTEVMLQNSIVLRLDGIGREEFLTTKYDVFLINMARILGTSSPYGQSNIVVFDIEESLQDSLPHESLAYRTYHSSSIVNSTLSVNVSFSARADGNDVESYLSSQYIEERIYLNRALLMQVLDVHVAPFQDNLCVREPCQNYQECKAIYKFDRAPKTFVATRNMIFRPIRAIQSFACNCPATFTGMNQKTECNIQINQCFSNPCLNGGICHPHESGYSCQCKPEFIGPKCEHSFANSTCQSISNIPSTSLSQLADDPTLKQTTMCSGKSRCVNFNHYFSGKPATLSTSGGGFSCQGCPYPQWSTELCQLKARSFSKGSYITLPSLKRRHRFHIVLKFATVRNDALILYNGRYNGKHDFIALEIVDSYLKFSYSLGSTVTTVSLASVSVSDGEWHKVAIDYKDRNVTLLVDDCDPVIDEALARIQGSTSRRCSNTSYVTDVLLSSSSSSSGVDHRMLDLTSPMQIGALLPQSTEFQTSQFNSFIGCMSDIYIDHQLVDLYTPIQDSGTQLGCPEKRSFCQQHSCNGHLCHDAWGAAKCSCGDDYLGKSCETLISNEKVRRFNGNSYLTFSPSEASLSTTWQVSLHFRTINPNGLLMKASLDPDASIILELYNGGLKLIHRSRNMTFNKINLDDGEWHHVEIIWSADYTQLQIDYNPNLAVQSSDMGSIMGSTIKSVTIGASPSSRAGDSGVITGGESSDFTSSVAAANLATQEDFSNIYSYNSSTQSFVGCIYGVNISDNSEQWITTSEERNVERGCLVDDICASNSCPANSRCIKKGMNQRRCVCNPGFVGDRCLPVCDLNPCQGENSHCYPEMSQTETSTSHQQIDDATLPQHVYSGSYRCECEPHRSGKNCEHQLSARCPSNWWGKPLAGTNSSICEECNCDESKGLDGDCDKVTRKCFCKPNHYKPTGDEYCLPCDCYSSGSLSASCNQTTGQCKCRPGVVGRRCDTCASAYAEVTLRGCEVIYDTCPKTFSDGIWWEKTQLDKTASQSCPPSTSTGTATRHCHKTEGWQKPNLFDCISNTFTDLYNQFLFFEESKFPINPTLAMKVARNLRDSLNETITNPSTRLYGSDIYISFRLLHHLIQHENQQTGLNLTHRQDRMYIRNIAESINYILNPAYAENWPEISKREPKVGAEHLLKLIDTYGKVLIESQSDLSNPPFEISTEYFTFGMNTISTDQLWDMSRSTTLTNPPSSPPYATDAYTPTLTSMDHLNRHTNGFDHQPHYNNDRSPVHLDYSLSEDSSPAIAIPKHDTYAPDSLNNDDTTRALIPLKTLRIKTLQELLPISYYQSKSRAKREELIVPEFKYSRQQPALVVYSIFRSLGPLLPSFYDNTVQHRLGVVPNSPVIWLTLKAANGTEFLNKNIQPKIYYTLKMLEPIGKTRPQCAVWDFTPNSASLNKNQTTYGIKQTGRFSTKGCEVKAVHPNHRLRFKYDYVNCSCDHLGAVTVLMDSASYDYLSGEDASAKDTASIVALGISVVIMTAAFFVLSFVRGHSIKSNSNSINKNLLFILIIIELLMLYTFLSKGSLNQREYHCKLVAIFLHYFSISLFFWLLVNAIHFYRLLTELRDINHGPMKFYHVIGYAVPAFFVSIAVGLRMEQFGNYLFCWLSIHEPIIWSMFGPISVVSCVTIILFLSALCKTVPDNEDPNGADLLKNHMLINIIKTPLIGIYWLIAVYVVNESLPDYVYLFPSTTVLKSLILFVLLCIVDKHIRYNLYVSWLRFRGEKVPFMEDSVNYSASQWMPPIMGESGALNKYNPYAGYGGGLQVTTPGFQTSYTDIFRPDVLAFSAASTTSRSSATGTSSSAYQYQQHRVSKESGYGRAERSGGRHRRRHKKSHHKHHHHRHHHHHHHHRSHRHQHADDYEHYDSRRRTYDLQQQQQQSTNDTNSHNDLASSHSSDRDDVSTLPKKNYISGSNEHGASTNDTQNKSRPMNAALASQLDREQQQTVPMELSAASTSKPQEGPKPGDEATNESAQYNA